MSEALDRAIRAGYEAVVEQSSGPLSAHDAVRIAAPALIASALAIDDARIEAIVKADFMEYGVYTGYNAETKEAEWQRCRGIELRAFKRRLSVLRRLLGEG